MKKILLPLVLIGCAMTAPAIAQTAPPVAIETTQDGTTPPPPPCNAPKIWSDVKLRCVHPRDHEHHGRNWNGGSGNGNGSSNGDNN